MAGSEGAPDGAADASLGALLARAFHQSMAGVAVLADSGRFLQVNEAFAAMLGRRRAELLAGRIQDFLSDDPRDGDDVFEAHRRGRAKVELPVRHADGHAVWLRCTFTRLQDGQPFGDVVLLGAFDVTEQRVLEAATRDHAAALHLLLEAVPDGIVIVGADGHITSVNRRTVEMFGYEEGELEGRPIEVLVPRRLHDVHVRYRVGYLEDPKTRPMGQGLDLTAVRKDGSEFPVEIGLGSTGNGSGTVVTCVITDISQRKSVEEELAHQATHDQLTGLPNRALFVDRARGALARAQRRGSAVAVLFVDLDRFKVINDSLGHGAGDAVLSEVGHRLQAVVRAHDTAARFGGDEFAVLCTDIDEVADAASVADRILAVLSEPITVADRQVVVTPSIGIATAPPEPFDADTLVRDADAAMYTAKSRGRGRFELFDEAVRARALLRLESEHGLRHALAERQLRVVYQPVISLGSSSIVGMEALVRWQHPSRGLVAPADFIPLAEETGLLGPIGEWVLGEACRQMAAWQQRFPSIGKLGMAVNLSPSQLRDGGLVAAVDRALGVNGLPAGSLTLEITETSVGDEQATAHEQLRALEARGVSLAIDDFGTGYSSLSRLRQLSVDAIKIDRSFVAGLSVDDDDTAIVAAVIDLAHALGLVAVAEGVETPAQLAALRALGCDHAQGYLFSRPGFPSDLAALLDRGGDAGWSVGGPGQGA